MMKIIKSIRLQSVDLHWTVIIEEGAMSNFILIQKILRIIEVLGFCCTIN